MGRALKFRVWDSSEKKWLTEQDMPISGDEGTKIFDIGNTWAEFTQYTGLKDRNGVEIYEGDIVISQYTFPSLVMWDDESCSFCFGVGGYLCTQQSIYPDEEWIVIGNIFENPELNEA